jgi:hypothetical protein
MNILVRIADGVHAGRFHEQTEGCGGQTRWGRAVVGTLGKATCVAIATHACKKHDAPLVSANSKTSLDMRCASQQELASCSRHQSKALL